MTDKQETLASLTELEKALIHGIFTEGYALDDLDDRFMCWGIDGKRERGALASLVKKEVVSVEPKDEDGCCPVYLDNDYTKREVAAAAGFKLKH